MNDVWDAYIPPKSPLPYLPGYGLGQPRRRRYSIGGLKSVLGYLFEYKQEARLPQFHEALSAYFKSLEPIDHQILKRTPELVSLDIRIQLLFSQIWFVILLLGEELNLSEVQLYKVQDQGFDVMVSLFEHKKIDIRKLRIDASERSSLPEPIVKRW